MEEKEMFLRANLYGSRYVSYIWWCFIISKRQNTNC